MRERTRDAILFAAIAVLAILAAWGWMRRPPETQAANSSCGQQAQPATNDQGAPQDQPVSGTYTYVNPSEQPSNDLPAYASRGYVRTVRPAPAQPEPAAQPPAEGEPAPEPNAAPAAPAAPAYAPRPARGGRAPVHYYTERSHKKSAMIIGGGAGTGAVIGAIAAGGEGAGIGALAGGVSAFIYDRLTHRHRVR